MPFQAMVARSWHPAGTARQLLAVAAIGAVMFGLALARFRKTIALMA